MSDILKRSSASVALGSDYSDDAPHFAARKYPGCFRAEEVQQHLSHRDCRPDTAANTEIPNVEHSSGENATPENHYLPDCLCAPLHSACNESITPETPPTSLDVTLDQLRYYGERGCWFCSVIYGGIVAAPLWDPKRQETIPVLPWFRMRADKEHHAKPHFSIKVFGDNDHNNEPKLVFYVGADAATSSPCALLLVDKEPSYTNPHQQLEFAAQSLQKCVENHSCTPPIPPSMPTRLLYIQVIDGMYAVHIVTDVSPQPYVTLSHCWGPSFPGGVTTTIENLEARMMPTCGISWELLPQTFRDAVALTERLGFQYLWIDALCIIQNSSADWMTESARMYDVYNHCTLMLSADASPDSGTGMFRASNMSWNSWSALPAPLSSTSSPDEQIVWRDQGVRAMHGMVHGITLPALAYRPRENLFHQRPLTTRAWCYQEHRLARRVLHLAVDEALWDCTGGILKCQCGELGPGKHEYGVFAWQRTLADRECSITDKHTLWMNTVYNYTERDLTVWTDRLPALSGLAKQFLVKTTSKELGPNLEDVEARRPFKEINLGTYLAGIWSSSLPLGLCWHAANIPGKRLSDLSGKYIAPSWSWASVSGNVNWNTDTFQPRCKVLDYRRDLAGPDPTGSISSGEICLEASIIPLKLYQGEQEIPHAGNGLRYAYIHLQARDPHTGEWGCPSMYLPDSYAPTNGEDVAFHAGADMIWGDRKTSERVESLESFGDGGYFGLQMAVNYIMIVRPVRGTEVPGVFERVGSVQRNWNGDVPDLSKWFEGAESRIVRLV
ncbi:heterokaryon incompatibility protein-domain-containing protein [Podospora australis]|uniref:Heterokaryon incompatibility protein-domain-containing protein n=1 Tax=Podospora australis TaxID=1536484 RepID=A0AAN6WJR4_9PEZI|nr:heterokaryon incompatibility protein-domain-containing protein [Podospora australis]